MTKDTIYLFMNLLNDLMKNRSWLLFWHVQTKGHPSLVKENISSFLYWAPSIRSRSISAAACCRGRQSPLDIAAEHL